jgi:hypothetical protein
MGFNTITDASTKGNKKVRLVKDTPDGVVRYFDHDKLESASNLDVYVELSFPNQKLSGHNLFINIEHIKQFLDKDAIKKEHLRDLSYNSFECYICMSGKERTLYTHENTRPVHFHRECYCKLADQIEAFLEDHIIAVQSEGKPREIK